MKLLSAMVVLCRFTVGASAEKTAARINAGLLYALGLYILVTSIMSVLGHGLRPQPSYLGMGLLLAAAIIMPWLGHEKRKLAVKTNSNALKADAAQSSLCAYMSWIALAGLVVNATFHVAWADSVAAMLLLPLVMHEANEARLGNGCSCA